VRRSARPTCLEVVRALQGGEQTDVQVGKTLEIYARSGLTQLGFADPDVKLPPVGAAQVTYLPIRDLPSPEPGTPRSEHSQAERVGGQIVRLIAMFAMHLMALDRGRLKIFSFDNVLLRAHPGRGPRRSGADRGGTAQVRSTRANPRRAAGMMRHSPFAGVSAPRARRSALPATTNDPEMLTSR